MKPSLSEAARSHSASPVKRKRRKREQNVGSVVGEACVRSYKLPIHDSLHFLTYGLL